MNIFLSSKSNLDLSGVRNPSCEYFLQAFRWRAADGLQRNLGEIFRITLKCGAHFKVIHTTNISESIYNLLYNENLNRILTKRQKSKLVKTIKSNLKIFEDIARKKIPSKIRKRKIIQSGSGIGTILLTLLPVISSLLFKK